MSLTTDGRRPVTPDLPVTPRASSGDADVRRTVILVEGETQQGQDLFVRGGIDHDRARALGRECTPQNLACAIPITHRNLRNATTAPLKANDDHLDWYGAEPGQLSAATGTPADWTTNAWPASWGPRRTVAVDGFGEEPLNKDGPHYWMVDVDMDCAATDNGSFEVKTFISNGPGWERDVHQPGAPYASKNHVAECGKLNVFRRGADEALILPHTPDPADQALVEVGGDPLERSSAVRDFTREAIKVFTTNQPSIAGAIRKARNIPPSVSDESILLRENCGPASKALFWLFRAAGIKTEGRVDNFYTPTHEFLVWRGAQPRDTLLVDATYRQFFADYARSVAINRAGGPVQDPTDGKQLAKRYEKGMRALSGRLDSATDAVLAEFPLPPMLVVRPERLRDTLIELHQRLSERYGELLMDADMDTFDPVRWKQKFAEKSARLDRWGNVDFSNPAANVTHDYEKPGVQQLLDPPLGV
jgi:hypothetical protein